MFRPSKRQTSLLESSYLMPEAKRARLLRSGARPFAERVMPLIDEEVFRNAYHQDNGRPNYPVRVLIGLHLLKEAGDLTDAETVEQFEFNLQWHHALGVTADEAHVAERTLRNFRHRMMQDGRARRSFELLTQRLAEHDGIDLGQQRFDSTHIMSNIRSLNRLGLFCETVRAFVANLDGAMPEAAARLPAEIRARYLERSGYFADAKREQARRRLPVVANDMYLLLGQFGTDAAVAALTSYQLMQRLFDEQCSVVQGTVCVEPTSEAAGNGGDNHQGDDAPDASGGASGEDDGLDQADSDRDSDRDSDNDSASAGGGDSADRGAGSLDASADNGCASAGGGDSADSGTSSLDASADNDGGGAASDASATSAACLIDGGRAAVQVMDPKKVSGASLQSPHDPDAAYGHKGKGCSVQLSETCSKANPYQLVTAVMVHGANRSDQAAVEPMLRQLLDAKMLPERLLADTGYGSGANLVAAAAMGVDLHAPMRDPLAPPSKDRFLTPLKSAPQLTPATDRAECVDLDPAHMLSELPESMPLAAFGFSTDMQMLLCCPGEQGPLEQKQQDGKLTAYFAAESCADCVLADFCLTRALADGRRMFCSGMATIATAVRQAQQRTNEFKDIYRIRSGIEATNSTLKSKYGMGNLRVRCEPRVTMASRMKAMALNVHRAVRYHVRRLAAVDAELSACPA